MTETEVIDAVLQKRVQREAELTARALWRKVTVI